MSTVPWQCGQRNLMAIRFIDTVALICSLEIRSVMAGLLGAWPARQVRPLVAVAVGPCENDLFHPKFFRLERREPNPSPTTHYP